MSDICSYVWEFIDNIIDNIMDYLNKLHFLFLLNKSKERYWKKRRLFVAFDD